MKQLILSIAFFGVLLANAQEMDTTFVINEQGQTVGIIHEKGTVPVMPQQQQIDEQAPQYPVQQYPAQQPQQQQTYSAQQANAAFSPDSTMYYQSLIDKYTISGNKTRRAGKIMMITGGIAAGVGVLFIASAGGTDCDRYDNECKDNVQAMDDAGALLLLGGGAVFTTGIILKIVGGSKLRKARRYEDSLQKYKMRQQYSLKLRFDPLIDPINKKAGANLAMEF
jgi:hypothetical protein